MPALLIECEGCGGDIVEGEENACDLCGEEPLCDECMADHECVIEDEGE